MLGLKSIHVSKRGPRFWHVYYYNFCRYSFCNFSKGLSYIIPDRAMACAALQTNMLMKGQSEIAYLPKFANMMLIVMVIVINEILYIILIFDCFENQ